MVSFVKRNKIKKLLRPIKSGLYNPINEHDSCGIGFVANIKGVVSHSIVQNGLEMLENLEHRGAVGADKSVGDGAGVLTKIPDLFFRNIFKKNNRILPPPQEYGVAMVFYPPNNNLIKKCNLVIKKALKSCDLELFFRDACQ